MSIIDVDSPSLVSAVVALLPEIFTDLWTLIALAIGLPLAFWVIRRIIGLIRARG